MATNNSLNISTTGIVKYDGGGNFTADTTTQYAVLIGGASNGITSIGPLTDGQLAIGSTGNNPVAASITATAGQGVSVTGGAGSITIAGIDATTAVKGVSQLATAAEVKTGTDSTKTLTPSTFTTYMADLDFTGFISWSAGGPYYSLSGTDFTLLVAGTGYILGKQITWSGGQTVSSLSAGSAHYIYIDNTATIGSTTTRTNALYANYIVLFEVLVDSAGSPNIFVTKENHPYSFPTTSSNYLHATAGTVINNTENGANITLNGTKAIQIDGADVLLDHGLSTDIPDSGGSAVTWHFMYTNGAGKWVQNSSGTTFPSSYNNAGTITALTANKVGVFRLYVCKDNLNSSSPIYFAVFDTSQYNSQALANAAILSNTPASATNELFDLEFAQLGFVTKDQTTDTVSNVVISKSTLRSTLSTGGGTTQASLISVDTSTFDHQLSAADTNVQSALNTLDDIGLIWQTIGASGALLVNVGYICTAGAALSFSLPATSAVGAQVALTLDGSTSWTITQGAGQSIRVGSSSTAVGAGGSLSSTAQGDTVVMVCSVANTKWNVISEIGNITVA